MAASGQEREAAAPEPELSLGDIVDRAGRRIATGLAIAGGVVALALYARPAPPRYEALTLGDQVVRLDTRSGSMIACDGTRCVSIHKRGQHIDRRSSAKALTKPAAAAPAPAPAPAQPKE